MTYITVDEASKKWNISTRRVRVLCSNGQISGAIKKSKVWMIPANAAKPEDGRKNAGSCRIEPLSLLFNPTYFENKNLKVPGKEERAIIDIQNKYLRGEYEEALSDIDRFMKEDPDYSVLNVVNILKMVAAIDTGNKHAYIEAYQSISVLQKVNKNELHSIFFGIYQGNSNSLANYYLINKPEFSDVVPLITLLILKKSINELISGGTNADITAFEIICRDLEEKNSPLICAYYHLCLAVYCNAMNMTELYECHIKRAAEIVIPKGWYTPLAEYSATINLDFIKEIDMTAYLCIQKLSKQIVKNYAKVGLFSEFSVNPKYAVEENVQIAFMVAHGKTNSEIAETLGISMYKVKQHIEDICQVIGAENKREIRQYIAKNFFV